jgi:DNA polymerase-3 subunit gamma/tau
MGQALYRKYRSKSLKEIVGQEHITQTLEHALKQGRLSHAYLFTGPRGVGKTSIARILAHQINDLPYTDDSTHMDIIEIDAASNRRIDEIRDLRDKVYVAPTAAKYKVYIIDEVHMLTREAFNALLKTLEEPPAHVVFILATTDAHKLPETIISRTQRFSFKPADKAQTVSLLAEIAQKEGFKVGPEALELLAEHGAGSFRDSISLLDQVSNQSAEVTVEDVGRLLGIPPAEALADLINALAGGAEPASVINRLTGMYDQGYQAAVIAKQLSLRLRRLMLENDYKLSSERILSLLDLLVEVPAAYDPERKLEIALLRAVPPKAQTAAVHVNKPVVQEPVKTKAAAEPKPVEPAKAIEPKPPAKRPATAKSLDDNGWTKVLQILKQRHNTLYGVLRMAKPDFSQSGQLTLVFSFSFHQKRLLENSNRQKLAGIIQEVIGQDLAIECLIDKSAALSQVNTRPAPAKGDGDDLTAISNIFGDAELLES